MDNRHGNTRRFVRVLIATRELMVHYPEKMTDEQAKAYALSVANEATGPGTWGVPRLDAILITPDGNTDRTRWRPTTKITAYDPPTKVTP